MSSAKQSTFFWPMALLSKQKREAMIELYRYCAMIDTIADEKAGLQSKENRLKEWEIALQKNATPLLKFNHIIPDFSLPKSELKAIITGMYMDIEEKMILPAYDTLQEYCRYVAGAVGILSLHIFGCYDQETKKLAIILGEALQFTNILRDVREDEKRGRLYIPKDFIAARMNPNQPIKALTAHPHFPLVWHDFANEAQKKFIECQTIFNRLKNRKTLWPARAMMLLYHQILLSLFANYKASHKLPTYQSNSSAKRFMMTARCAIGFPPALQNML